MPHATAQTFAPPDTSRLAPAETSILALLAAIERRGLTGSEPAAIAFTAAIRRQGREASEAGGTEALDYLLARIREAGPALAGTRESILDNAWSGLPGWRS